MKVDGHLKNILSPKQMKSIKRIVMHIRFMRNRRTKYGLCTVNENVVDQLYTFSLENKHLFFGYYDIQQFDQSNKRLLAHIVDRKKCNPASDAAEIAFIDFATGKIHPFTKTRAWSWQQGARLRWHPTDEGCVIYNDFENERFEAVVWDINKKCKRTAYPLPFYDIAPDGSYGLSLNFSRLQRLRPGYGYSNSADATRVQPAPETEGIILYDTSTGEEKMLITLRDLSQLCIDKGKYDHYVNHISIAPSGTKFLFFHLWTSEHRSDWNMALYVMNLNDNSMQCVENRRIVSHYCWKNDEEILVTTAAMRGEEPQYIRYNLINNTETILEGSRLKRDGHPSFIHGSENFISDTYPVNCMQYMFAEHGSAETELLSIFSDPRLFDDLRCDLHPRLTEDNEFISLDTTYKDRLRQIIVLKIKKGML